MNDYHFLLISVLVFGAYFGSLGLVKMEKLELIKQRQFWNLVLLISFLVSGILGLILAFTIDQKIAIGWYLPILRLHVKFGIIMALVAIFHALWHWWYFKGIVKKK